ncbi:MAG: HAMP domain-containing sensor histidine kinase [Pseudomonadota bacterium]
MGLRLGWGFLALPLLAAMAFLLITLWIRVYERAQVLQNTSSNVALMSMNAFHMTEARVRENADRLIPDGQARHPAHSHHEHGGLTLEQSVMQLRDGAQVLQIKFGDRPRTDTKFFTAPFTVAIDWLGLADVTDELREVWEGEPGQASIGALLDRQIGTCAQFCLPPGQGPVQPTETLVELADVVVGELQPRLLKLNAAAVRWERELLFHTRIAVLIAVLAVIGGIMFTRLRIVDPLLAQLDEANKELQERNQSLERRVEARTSELTEALAQVNEANSARARLLASVNHELRTPMTGVLGVAALLERTHLDEAQKNLVGTVMESGRTLLRLIDDMMDIVCADASEITIAAHPGNFAQLARRTLDLLRSVAVEKGLVLRVDSSQTVDFDVLIDPDRMAQILNNVVGNAIKFTETGSVGVGLRQIERPEAVLAEITVQDTGPGIPVEAQTRIFDPFERGSGGAHAPGTGLGLAVTHSLVQRMGGSIDVDSAPGKGSCFTIRLPMRRADDMGDAADGAAA